MKKTICTLFLIPLLLCGCSPKEATYLSAETISYFSDTGNVAIYNAEISVGDEKYLEFEITNKTETTLLYSEYYSLHYCLKSDKELELVKPKRELAFDDVLHTVFIGNSAKIRVDLSDYDLSRTGKYQLWKDYYLEDSKDQYFIIITFEITNKTIADILFNSVYVDAGYSEEGLTALYSEYINKNSEPTISSYREAPLIKIASLSELEEFKEKYKSYFSFNNGYDEILSFEEACKTYKADFFKKRTLFICYIIDGSGSVRHKTESVRYSDKTLTFNIKAEMPEIGTCDMCGRFLLIDILTADINSANEYRVVIN